MVLVTVVAGACAPVTVPDPGGRSPSATAAEAEHTPALTFLSEWTRPAGTVSPQLSENPKFGSISGLVRDAVSGEWLGVIDDRVGTRVAWLSLTAADGRLDVSPLRMQYLKAGPGIEDRIATQADLEGVVALPDGTFLMSEEGHRTRAGVWPPAILQVTRDGVVTGTISYPAAFQISDDQKTGIRDNQGFESLTRTPAGRVITGLEQPTFDKPVTSTDRAGDGLLLEFEQRGQQWVPGRQWQYAISPTPTVPGFPTPCSDGENGLVELLALTETTLISMERACWLSLKDEPANTILLFAVTLSGNTARKTLLLDLSTITAKLSPALAMLDNFEGLAFGPTVGGRRSLLVMSDDNFRPRQKTSLLLFGMQ
jgi:hypothetical protein